MHPTFHYTWLVASPESRRCPLTRSRPAHKLVSDQFSSCMQLESLIEEGDFASVFTGRLLGGRSASAIKVLRASPNTYYLWVWN